jgi:glycosyltransferase involved in cell wall biosynthesis
MDMGVSVIIPVYNGEKSIGKALDSLLNQTYKHFEVVIINDGSTDRTENIVQEYPRRGMTIRYVFQDNMGVAMARNRGLDLAKGQYVCFLDSDDFYEQRFMERMLRQISSTGSDVCYCGYKVVTPNRVRNRRTQFTEKRVLLKYVLGKVAVQTTGWMLRSDLIAGHSLRFPPGISCGEDFEFFCESLALARKTTFLKEYLTNNLFHRILSPRDLPGSGNTVDDTFPAEIALLQICDHEIARPHHGVLGTYLLADPAEHTRFSVIQHFLPVLKHCHKLREVNV